MPRKNTKKRSPKPTPGDSGLQRLQRVLAAAGYGARRSCEELILEGRVHVDGQIVDKLGTTVDPKIAKIFVDGQPLKRQRLVYYAVNKPVGVVTTNRDPQGRPRVIDLVPPDERVFPVGRLDLSSEGLILLTNDGDLAQQLTHPSYGVRKVYRVTVAGKVENETMKKMREGIYIAEGFVQVDGAKLLKARGRSTELEITLREGKNREIRRILARLGHKVQQLRRIAVGPLKLHDLPIGAHRLLMREEVDKLRGAIEAAEAETKSNPVKKRPAGVKRKTTKKFATASPRVAAQQAGRKTGKGTTPVAKESATKRSSTNRSATKRSATKPSATKPTTAKQSATKRSEPSFKFPKKKSASGGVIIGADEKPTLDRSTLKEHVVKPRPKGGKKKSVAKGRDNNKRRTKKR